MTEWQDGPVRVLVGDVRERLRELPDASIHCVVTSPPYWGLRDYHAANQIGLEATPDEFVAAIVDVFGEVRRVLRPDGMCWLNLGDSYAGDRGNQDNGHREVNGKTISRRRDNAPVPRADMRIAGLKPKDLVGIPWRIAFALQADGWWLRSDVVWAKPNPMPESVTDRPTKAHEYVFLLTKAERYFYDAEAVREPLRPKTFTTFGTVRHDAGDGSGLVKSENYGRDVPIRQPRLDANGQPAGANLRSVWTMATQPYPEAHFATFPEELARRCVLAGTSEHGCCPACGAPWRRATVRVAAPDLKRPDGWDTAPGCHGSFHRRGREAGMVGPATRAATTGWEPTCAHGHDPAPCVVLDPFAGSGTTLAVARALGRQAVGIELQPGYLPLIQRRVAEAACPLLEARDAALVHVEVEPLPLFDWTA